MSRRSLSPEERAAWAALARTVTPLRARRVRADLVHEPAPEAAVISAPVDAAPATRIKGRVPPPRSAPVPAALPGQPRPVPQLDGTWERKIRSGRLDPDISIDLHGLTLSAAHARLDRLLGDATAFGWRILHVVTGKPRSTPMGEARKRGVIRAEIGDWLAHSPYGHRIASVRQAHPRHGGEGAIYIILRR